MSASHEAGTGAQAMVRRLLAAARDKSDHLAAHLHPGWIEAVLSTDAPDALRHAAVRQGSPRASRWLAQACGVRWPDLASLRTRAHRFALLPGGALRQALAVVALGGRSGDVRRCVGRPARQALIALVGEPAYAELLRLPDAGGRAAPITEADLLPDAAAADGHRLLLAHGLLHCVDAASITRLSLPPVAGGAPDPMPGTPPSLDAIAGLLGRFDTFFPEQAWMFGSDMDRALSACPTA